MVCMTSNETSKLVEVLKTNLNPKIITQTESLLERNAIHKKK